MNYVCKALKFIIFVILLSLTLPAIVQAQVSISGEFRPRTEFRNGYRILSTPQNDPAFFTSQRTRLNLRYKKDQYTLKFSGQDIRTWGEVEQLGDIPNVNIHEVWAELNLNKSLQLKLGRQELIYDDHRLLGNVNWTQQARSHDALLLKYRDSSKKLKIDIGAAYNQEGENLLGNAYTLQNYKVLSYAWINKEFGLLNASGIILTDGFEIPNGDVNYCYTYGTHINYRMKPWNFAGTLYLQNGDDANRRNISAWMFAAAASYQINAIQFKAGYDHLSGGSIDDENPAGQTFNTLYATNHKFYGHMDYFLNIPADTRNGGLQDFYLSTGYQWTENTAINLTYHHFALAEEIQIPTIPGGTLDQNLASEIDFSFSHRFADDIEFRAGYSAIFSQASLENLQQRDAEGLQHWGWIMLSVTPQIWD